MELKSAAFEAAEIQAHARIGIFDRMARAALRRHFASLATGRLVFDDAQGSTEVGGGDDVVRLRVRDPRFYRRVALGGTLGAAESYLRGEWECADLVALFRLFLRELDLADATDEGVARVAAFFARIAHRRRRNTRRGSRRNIRAHYDLGNDLFATFLDPSMTYSCALFETESASLERAQEAKLERIAAKLALREGDRVLEIGGGWGSFARFAAGRYGCRVTTTTISREQYEAQRARLRTEGLDDRVDVLLTDYRDLRGRFDKVVSIEMVEAVGYEGIGGFLKVIDARLEPHGAALVQGITLADSHFERYRRSVDFIQAYVFPGSCLVSTSAFVREAGRAGSLRVEHVEDIGPHYVGTLRAWRHRFRENLDAVRRLGATDRFIRLWEYYFAYCEAGFLERFLGDAQFLLAKPRWRGPAIPALPESPW